MNTKRLNQIPGWVAVIVLVTAAVALYVLVLYPQMLRDGATDEEASRELLGDEMIGGETLQMTMALDIQAEPEVVWSWLVQLGQERAGFYSYDFLEGIFPFCQIHNANRINPAWQERQVGDFISTCEGIGGWWVAAIEPNRHLVFFDHVGFTFGLFLKPTGDGQTRLLTRTLYAAADTLTGRAAEYFWMGIHGVMQKGVMLGIRQRAEGQWVVPSLLEGSIWWSAFVMLLISGALVIRGKIWWQPALVGIAATALLVLLVWFRPRVGWGFLADLALLAALARTAPPSLPRFEAALRRVYRVGRTV